MSARVSIAQKIGCRILIIYRQTCGRFQESTMALNLWPRKPEDILLNWQWVCLCDIIHILDTTNINLKVTKL